LGVIPGCAPQEREANERRRQVYRLGSSAKSDWKHAPAAKSSPASTTIRGPWERSAQAQRSARGACARVCRFARLRLSHAPPTATPTGTLIAWFGDWLHMDC